MEYRFTRKHINTYIFYSRSTCTGGINIKPTARSVSLLQLWIIQTQKENKQFKLNLIRAAPISAAISEGPSDVTCAVRNGTILLTD